VRGSNDMRESGESRARMFAIAAGLVALVAIAYSPAFSAEFLNYDDDALFTTNYAWRGLGPAQLAWIWRSDLMGHFVPLTWMSFGLDHALHGLSGPDYPEAGWYHATSVALHALGALAFFAVALKLIDVAALFTPGERVWSAALAATLWAVHPLRVESVVWLTERRDVMCGLFFLLALLAWLAWAEPRRVAARSKVESLAVGALTLAAIGAALAAIDVTESAGVSVRSVPSLVVAVCAWLASVALVARAESTPRRLAFAAASACMLLSLLGKATSMVLPVLLVVLDVWPLRRWRRAEVLALAIEKLPLVTLSIVIGRIAFSARRTGITLPLHTHSLQERMGQAFYGLCHYPAKTLAPIDLLPMYDFPRAMSLSDPRWFIPVIAVGVVSYKAFTLRKQLPAFTAAWCAYGVMIGPLLGLVQSGPQLVGDRYSYLACMPFTLLLSAIAVWFARGRRAAVVAIAIALTGAAAFATWRQASFWSTSARLWQRAHAIEPRSATNLMSMGGLRSLESERAGDPARALALLVEADDFYRRAFALDDDPLYLRSRSQVHTRMSDVDVEHSEQHLQEALDLSGRALALAQQKNVLTPEYRLDYGTDLLNVGRLDEGIEHLQWFVGKRPQSSRGLLNLGGALVLAGRAEEALAHLNRACELEPNDPRPWSELGRAYQALGRAQEAAAAVEHAQRLGARH
jgi:tetratricopeptide (TPR) repeat protein